MAVLREGYLEQLLHILAHLNKYHNTEFVCDPSEPSADISISQQRDWASSEFGHLKENEVLPTSMPHLRGLDFVMTAEVDVDHAGDTHQKVNDLISSVSERCSNFLVFQEIDKL